MNLVNTHWKQFTTDLFDELVSLVLPSAGVFLSISPKEKSVKKKTKKNASLKVGVSDVNELKNYHSSCFTLDDPEVAMSPENIWKLLQVIPDLFCLELKEFNVRIKCSCVYEYKLTCFLTRCIPRHLSIHMYNSWKESWVTSTIQIQRLSH